MREQCLRRFRLRSAGWRLGRKPVGLFLDRRDRFRRGVARQMEDCRGESPGGGCELAMLGAEAGIRAQQADIGERVLQQRIVALEALRQFLFLCRRRGQAIGRTGVEPFARA